MEHHQCLWYKSGDEIIFRCAMCPQFEMRFNAKTGKMWKSGNQDPNIAHHGTNHPSGVNPIKGINVNQ